MATSSWRAGAAPRSRASASRRRCSSPTARRAARTRRPPSPTSCARRASSRGCATRASSRSTASCCPSASRSPTRGRTCRRVRAARWRWRLVCFSACSVSVEGPSCCCRVIVLHPAAMLTTDSHQTAVFLSLSPPFPNPPRAAMFQRGGAAAGGAGRPAVTPPALVCEYLAGGSLRAAINARADFLASPQARVKLLLDTARVRAGGEGHSSMQRIGCTNPLPCPTLNPEPFQIHKPTQVSYIKTHIKPKTPIQNAGPRLPPRQEDRERLGETGAFERVGGERRLLLNHATPTTHTLLYPAFPTSPHSLLLTLHTPPPSNSTHNTHTGPL